MKNADSILQEARLEPQEIASTSQSQLDEKELAGYLKRLDKKALAFEAQSLVAFLDRYLEFWVTSNR